MTKDPTIIAYLPNTGIVTKLAQFLCRSTCTYRAEYASPIRINSGSVSDAARQVISDQIGTIGKAESAATRKWVCGDFTGGLAKLDTLTVVGYVASFDGVHPPYNHLLASPI